jgi:aspartate/methionine/tyrosine aminotransferase
MGSVFSSRVPADRTRNRIATRVADLRAAGVPFLDLTLSDPTLAGIAYPEGLLDGLSHPRALVHRPDPLGLPEARRAVAQDLARRALDVPPERIVITASTSEAYALLFKLLCDPGDRVSVPRPGYPLFEHLTALEGVATDPYELVYDGAWRVDFTSLERAFGPRTRAILAVSPNNPTGSCLTTEEIARLATACRARSLALVGDEVFADHAWNGPPPPSVLEQERALTFALGGLSKSVGLPQLKLAWIAVGGPRDLVAEALDRLEVVCDAYLSVATPVQLALPGLLERGALVRERIRARVAGNLAVLDAALARHPACRRLRADGGWCAVLRIPAADSEEAIVLDLLERDHVLVHPGYFFDFPSEGFVVVSLLPPAEELRRGVDLMLARAARP